MNSIARPKSVLGKFILGSLAVFIIALLFRIMQADILFLHTRAGDIMAVFSFFFEYIAAAAAIVAGLIALIKNKERYLLILAYVLIPFDAIAYILARGLFF